MIRCTTCYKEYKEDDKEIVNAMNCPNCHSVGVPMDTSQDIELKINWHELRILTIWATNFCNEKLDVGSKKMLKALIERLYKQKKQGFSPLTLEDEIKELQETFPNAEVYDGNGKLIMKKKTIQ